MSTHASVTPDSGKAQTNKPASAGQELNQQASSDFSGPQAYFTPHNLLVMQRSMGNRAVVRLLRGESATDTTQANAPRKGAIQPKLQVGPVDDPYEREADEMASQVMRKPLPVQRDQEEEEEESSEMVQPQRATVQRHHHEDETVQAKRFDVQRNFPTGATAKPLREEDAIQTKRSLVQRAMVQRAGEEEEEEAESVQLKRATIQRHHNEEETVQAKRSNYMKVGYSLQRASDNHRSGCGCGSCSTTPSSRQFNRLQRAAHNSGCNCKECSGVKRKAPAVRKDGSFDADENLTSQVRNLDGGGRPLPDKVRGNMESRFGADFSGVRVHTGNHAANLNRSMSADAFTYRQNIAFNSGKYNPGSSSGQRLLAHELTHTLQQTGGVARAQRQHQHNCKCQNCGGVKRKATPAGRHPVQRRSQVKETGAGIVQRHSSWEHKLIGDLTPKDLSIVGAARDSKALHDDFGDTTTVEAGDTQVSHATVLHVLEQEIARLRSFQSSEMITKTLHRMKFNEERAKERDMQRRKAQAKDQQEVTEATQNPWNVKFVGIRASDGRLFSVTYGELNTLADFYGSVEEMKKADAGFLERVIRGVREASLNEMIKLYTEVSGLKKEKHAKKKLGIKDTKFGNKAIGLGGTTLGIATDELKLMGALPLVSNEKKGVKGESTTGYKETLARNACHFPPESWHAWAIFHEKARALAKESYVAKQKGDRDIAEDKLNEALLQNGFGDHYLQDSYASGHLINKTQIMQWYVEWLDQNPYKWDAHKNKNWRGMQQMAYNQSELTSSKQYDKSSVDKSKTNPNRRGAQNPQSVANEGGSWSKQFKNLGLQLPGAVQKGAPGFDLLVWWQKDIIGKWKIRNPREKTFKTLKKNGPGDVKGGLQALVQQGIVRPTSWSGKSLSEAKKNGINPKDGDSFTLRQDYVAHNAKSAQEVQDDSDNQDVFNRKARAAVFEDYRAFMQSSFIQKATNSLHDYYCKNGLSVYAGDSTEVFKVYGDDNMLQRGSAKGLMHSGTTARMSQSSIEYIGSRGNDGGLTKKSIIDRFPEGIELTPGGTKVSLEDWHSQGTLKHMCFNRVFPSMSKGSGKIINKIAPGLLGSSLGNVTPAKPHGDDAF